MNEDRRVRRSKKDLKKALICLLGTKSLRQITISELVKQADYNRSTFYRHYQYKEDLLQELTDEVIEDLKASYREPYQKTETFMVADLSYSAITIFDHVLRYADFYKLVFKSNALPGFQNRMIKELKEQSERDLNESQPDPRLNPELRAIYLINATMGLIMEWVSEDFQYTSSYLAKQLLEIMKNAPNKVIYKRKTAY